MENKGLNTCVACKETSEQVALHYTRMMCNGCRAFFKRTVQGKVKLSECKSEGQCVIDPNTRKLCKACRFEACQRAGVDITKVQQPKEEEVDVNRQDTQFHPDLHIDGNHRLVSLSFLPQTSYPQFQIPVQGSHISPSMYPTSHAINDHASSMGTSVFNHSLAPKFVSGNTSNLHASMENQPQLHLSNNHQASTYDQASLQMWRSAALGSHFPGTDSNRPTSIYHLPYYLSSSQREAEALSYVDVAKNVALMRQGLLYHSNVPASPDTTMSYPGSFSQAALANYAQLYGAHDWNNGYGPYTMPGMNTSQSYLYDTSHIPQITRPTISHPLTATSAPTSSMIVDPYSGDALVRADRKSFLVNEQYERCNSRVSDVDVKEETCDHEHEATHAKKSSESTIEVSSGLESRLVSESPNTLSRMLVNKTRCLEDNVHGVLPVSMTRHESVLSPQRLRRSKAFTIDMLLRPQHSSVKQHDDGESDIFVPQLSGQVSQERTWSSHARNNTSMAQFSETDRRLVGETHLDMTHPVVGGHDAGLATTIRSRQGDSRHADATHTWPGAINESSGCESHFRPICEVNPDRVRQASLQRADDDTSLYDSSEDTAATNTETRRSREPIEESEQEMKISENGSSQIDSDGENVNKIIMTDSDNDVDDKASNTNLHHTHPSLGFNNTNLHHTHPSLGLNKTPGANSSDSGLGNSGQNFSCENTDIKSKKSHNDNASNARNVLESNEYNNENVPVTPSKKRKRLFQTENTNSKLARIYQPNLLPERVPTRQCFRNSHLTEILGNGGQKKRDNKYYQEKKRSLPSFSSTDSSSDDDAPAKLRPQLTSTPVACRRNDVSRRFLKLMCAFAEFYKNEDMLSHSSATTADKQSSSITTADKLSSSFATADKLSSSISTADKLSSSITTADKLSSSITTADKLSSSITTADNLLSSIATADKLSSSIATADKLSSSITTADKLSSSWSVEPGQDSKLRSTSSLSEQSFNEASCPVSQPDKMDNLVDLQQELMRKVRCVNSYTMAEFKADVCRLNCLVQEARTKGKL